MLPLSSIILVLAAVGAVTAAPRSERSFAGRRVLTALAGDNSTFTETFLPLDVIFSRRGLLDSDVGNSLVGRQTCPGAGSCLLGYFSDGNPQLDDGPDETCLSTGQTRVAKGCYFNCDSEPTFEESPYCNGGWALYGYPAAGYSCLECIPGCIPTVGGPDEPEC